MNQILITEKLYVTPELKKKKKRYKIYFVISIIFIIFLLILSIYYEYDRNKSEQVSKEILENMNNNDSKTDIIMVVLNNENISDTLSSETSFLELKSNKEKYETVINGFKCTAVAEITIPKLNINYPILKGETGSKEETEALLKSSPIEFYGNGANKPGNFCVAGHNYRNEKFFSKILNLDVRDIIEIEADNRKIEYAVYDKYEVIPEDDSCTNQNTNGKKEVTLITCTNDSKKRVIVKAREI